MIILNNKFFFLTIIISPLISFITIGLLGTNFFLNIINKKITNFIAISSILLSTFISFKTFLLTINGHIYNINIYTWIKFNNLKIKFGFLIDNLTSIMMLMITFISLIVYIYSIEYMKNDKGYKRFFCYLSLFIFSILILIMSNNLLQLFFGWELVGIVSYLLIGFWYKKKKANKASIKSFLINRIGDCGLLIAIGLIFSYTNSFKYNKIFKNLHFLKNIYLYKTNILITTIICICLFIGVISKSAQFPLHIWLPNSMEGPTPVSALIHAATMVTAGIFIISRLSPIFELSKNTLSIILIIGGITSMFMGILAIIQNDIKKIIAYSTISQLGYMTMALGASAYSIAIFHLITHAFFKALLFLCAGSIIINNNHIQDIRYINNNIKKNIPITWATFLISIFSLIGIPFFSGFYSKESIIKILSKTKITGSNFAYFSSLFSILITTLYSFRMYFKIFHKTSKKNINNKKKKSNYFIKIPLIILSIPSFFLGYFLIKPIIFKNFFKKCITTNINFKNIKYLKKIFINPFLMSLKAWKTIPFLLIIIGIFITYYVYIININFTTYLKNKFNFIYKILKKKYFIDIFFKKISYLLILICKKMKIFIEKKIFNNFFLFGIIKIIKIISKFTKSLNSGYIHKYIFTMIIGLLMILIYLPIKF
ncbi:NADH-quinone oxidoreductase subunit L [Candidatus Zinderia endosymbiont of Aphrophora alni]|uniref:NADH-quinone oxidoreductase subunit L n=1 Tax=Candidatus Zinderia endosymbiont of Aphrophora alni TaxID=3077951 RepID=UPI0030CBE9F1